MSRSGRESEGRCRQRPKGPGSPEAADTVPVEKGFTGNENEVAHQGLGDEHSVERVSMRTRQRAGSSCLLESYWQFIEPFCGYGASDVGYKLVHGRQPTETVLGRDFPGRRGTDQFVVRLVSNGPSGGKRQPIAAGEPPY